MEEDAAKAQARPLQNLVLEFTDEEFKTLGEAALADGELIPAWAKRILNEIASEDIEELAGGMGNIFPLEKDHSEEA